MPVSSDFSSLILKHRQDGDLRAVLFIRKKLSGQSFHVITIGRNYPTHWIKEVINELTPLQNVSVLQTTNCTLDEYHEGVVSNADVIAAPKWIVDCALSNEDESLQKLKIFFETLRETSYIIVVPLSRIPGEDHCVIKRNYGEIHFELLPTQNPNQTSVTLQSSLKIPRPASLDLCWPLKEEDDDLFSRHPVDFILPGLKDCAVFIARADAVPSDAHLEEASVIWAAGLRTWKKLCDRGIWVNGSTEGLGEHDEKGTVPLFSFKKWIKLTHQEGIESEDVNTLSTYKLVPSKPFPDLSEKTHFFWKSRSLFLAAIEKFPGILNAFHSSGPGHTFEALRQYIAKDRIQVFLSFHDWKKELITA